MPQVWWFEEPSIAVSDWHCPGREIVAGVEECAPTYQLSIGRAGIHALRFGGAEVMADATRLLCVNAGESFRPMRRVLGLDRRTYIHLSQDAVRELARDADPRNADAAVPIFPTRSLPLSARAALAHHALVRQFHSGQADQVAVHELALELAGLAFHVPARGLPGATRSVRDAVHAIQEIVARRFAERIPLAVLAAHVHLSPWHLSRSFHAHVGMRLHQYVTRVRLFSALERIRACRRQGRLTQVALEVGFSSHSHMTREFKAFFGAPPSHLLAGPSCRRASSTC